MHRLAARIVEARTLIHRRSHRPAARPDGRGRRTARSRPPAPARPDRRPASAAPAPSVRSTSAPSAKTRLGSSIAGQRRRRIAGAAVLGDQRGQPLADPELRRAAARRPAVRVGTRISSDAQGQSRARSAARRRNMIRARQARAARHDRHRPMQAASARRRHKAGAAGWAPPPARASPSRNCSAAI